MSLLKRISKKLFPRFYDKLAYLKILDQVSKFKKKYPKCNLFYNLYVKNKQHFYSQHNQDYIVLTNFFKDKKAGVFCDIGGNHPLNINNTRYFEELGWSGYAFEPLKYMEPLWKKHRKAKFFPYGASDVNGEVTFSIVKNETGWEDTLSFVKKTQNIECNYASNDVIVQTRILKEVFKEEAIKHIDYMSIDVEGHELNVLKGIDFNEVRINVLTIENNPSCCMAGGSEDIREIMFNNNYILWGRIISLDDIYVHKDFLNSINS